MEKGKQMTTAIRETENNGFMAEQTVWDDSEWMEPFEAAERRARGLGWFSIGLGLAQIGAPRAVARMIGLGNDEASRNAMFAIGMREIASGVGILAQPRKPGWVWSRVGGDVMDLALLGSAFRSEDANRNRLALTTAAVVGATVLDVLTSQQLGRNANGAQESERFKEVTKIVTINRPPEEVYRFWRNFENLPRFMEHLESVTVLDDRRSRWKAKAPAGRSVEWDAEITEDRPGEMIAWRSVEGSDIGNRGTVRFLRAPQGRGTEVRVDLQYDPPGGMLGATIAKLFGEEPGIQVDGDLRRFKQVMEIGEVVRSDASVHDGPHPARPSAAPM